MPERITQPVPRFREYEIIYILRSDVDSDAAEKVASRVSEVITRENGKLLKVENWGRRKLAYEIAKQRRGVYTFVKFLGKGPTVSELERSLRLQDSVIRYQTVLTRSDVIADDVAVDPEELKFSPLEPLGEDDKEETREKLLGLVDSPEERRHSRRDDDHDDTDLEVDLNPDLNFGSDEEGRNR
jgi:small subunit ribosomal protein S6